MNKGYAICFNEWIFDARIKNELPLLLYISQLTAQDGYCYATNDHFAEKFKNKDGKPITKQTISEKINYLAELGYIKIDYEKRGAEITRREIRLSKTLTDDSEKAEPTIRKKPKENIINKDEYSYAHAREENQTQEQTKSEDKTLTTNPTLEEKEINKNQISYATHKTLVSQIETKPVNTSMTTIGNYTSHTSPKAYGSEKEWFNALRLPKDIYDWTIPDLLYKHLVPYLEKKKNKPLQEFEIIALGRELMQYVGVSQLEIVRRCVKGKFNTIKPFGTDKLRKHYPDMAWELGNNYEI